jgi:hypothetical protein
VGHRIGMAVVCLHISAVLYLLAGVLMLLFYVAEEKTGAGFAFGLGILVFCLALIAGIEFVVFGLQRREFWAWIAGLCIFGISIDSRGQRLYRFVVERFLRRVFLGGPSRSRWRERRTSLPPPSRSALAIRSSNHRIGSSP